MRKHYVVFYSPGTFVAETSQEPIEEWSPRIAVGMAEKIVERYDSTPYGFRFETRLVRDPIPDGEGGTLTVASKKVAESGMYFLGGRLRTVDDVATEARKDEEILLSNMLGNDYPIVVEVVKRWKSTQPFDATDCIVDATGDVVERGNHPKWVEYRAKKIAERQAWRDGQR